MFKLLQIVLFIFAFCVYGRSQTQDLLPEWTFTVGIEGPATAENGSVYAVNYEKEGTIGIVYPDGTHACFMVLPKGSTGNGIRFDRRGNMLVADYTGHNILRIDMDTYEVSVLAHEPAMNQPNDIALSPEGWIYASDPRWNDDTGQLWLITPDGQVTLLETDMGTTNGVEVSPDGKTLYVNESVQRNVWAYDILPDGRVANKRLFHRFDDFGMDGMRCDEKGNLYVCRYGKGTVAVLNPAGMLLGEVTLTGQKPTNLTFAGKDRHECYVTLQDRGCFEVFPAMNPGRE